MPASIAPPVTDDPFDFARHADPYPGYRRVRETNPVYWSGLLHAWVLTRYADVKAANRDPAQIPSRSLRPAALHFYGGP